MSYQLRFRGILECVFEDSGQRLRAAAPGRALRGGLRSALAERDWRAHGILPVEIRAFCAWRNAPMVLISNTGEPLDRFEPPAAGAQDRGVHLLRRAAFFHRNARPVLEQMGCGRDPKQAAAGGVEVVAGRDQARSLPDLRETGGSCCLRSATCARSGLEV